MAYVNKEKSKTVKAELQAAFPKSEGWEFSVSIEHHTTLNVVVMRAPINLIETTDEYELKRQYQRFNEFYLHEYKNAEVLQKIYEIANKGNFNNSDSQSDYFHVGFYLNISAGKWNKPFQLAADFATATAKTDETPAVAVNGEEARAKVAASVEAENAPEAGETREGETENVCYCNAILAKKGCELVCGDCGRTFQRSNGQNGGALIQTARPTDAAEKGAPAVRFSEDFETREEMEEVAAYFEGFSKHHAAENARRFEQQLDGADCALSEMASSANQRLYSAKAAAVRAGLVSDFRILTDLDGNKINAKQVNTKYGLKWMIADENGNALEWLSIPYSERQAANLAKKGYKEAFEKRRSWVKLAGGAIYSLSVIDFEIPAGEPIQDIEKAKKAIAARKAAAAASSAEPSNVIPFNKAA